MTPDAAEIGSLAPDFSLPDPSGRVFTRDQLAGANGTLVAFICNHCPYVVAIAERLADTAAHLSEQGVSTVAICANDARAYPDDAPDRMAEFAARHGFGFPYLVDESQAVARAYGAVCTPDFFGYDKGKLLQYRGRLDDSGRSSSPEATPELLNAMRQIAETGTGPTQQWPSVGCSIKWKAD